MALVAGILIQLSSTADYTIMAAQARYRSLNIHTMIDPAARILFGQFVVLVTQQALSGVKVLAVALKVTDKTGIVDDGDMFTHDVPGVACCAAEDLSAPEQLQVRCVVEGDVSRIGHASFEQPVRVAALPQTGCVFHLGSRVASVCPCEIIKDTPKSPEIRIELLILWRRQMALDTGYIAMAGVLPFIIVRPHHVAAVTAENGGFRCSLDTPDSKDEDDKDDQQDLIQAQFFKENGQSAKREDTRLAFHPDLLPEELVNL